MGTPTASLADHNAIGWRFDNTYARLPDTLFAPATPVTVRGPRVSVLNHRLADDLGLDLGAITTEAAAALFAGQDRPAGSLPIAQAYAGHQFGHFTMLGDGRAILLGEHRTPAGRLVDIQFKGAGQTRFSRGGDGLAALGRCSASTSSARPWPPSASPPRGASRSSPPASRSTGSRSGGGRS